jgi:hypothetical protein
MANFAADSSGNQYPSSIANWAALVSIVNANGGTLKSNSQDLQITSVSFSSDGSDYTLTMTVNVPDGVAGKTITVTPGGRYYQVVLPRLEGTLVSHCWHQISPLCSLQVTTSSSLLPLIHRLSLTLPPTPATSATRNKKEPSNTDYGTEIQDLRRSLPQGEAERYRFVSTEGCGDF